MLGREVNVSETLFQRVSGVDRIGSGRAEYQADSAYGLMDRVRDCKSKL